MAGLLDLFNDPVRMGLLASGVATYDAAKQGSPNAAMIGPQYMQALQQQMLLNKRQKHADDLTDQEFGMKRAEFQQQQDALQELGAVKTGNSVIDSLPPKLRGDVVKAFFAKQFTQEQPASIQGYEYAVKQGYKGSYEEWLKNAGAEKSAYFTPIYGQDGRIYSFNARSGGIAPVNFGGAQLAGAQYDPNTQRNLKDAQKTGEVTGEVRTNAQIDLPKIEQTGSKAISDIDALLKSPGLATATGLSSKLDPRNYLAGTDAADAKARINQVRGRTFLEAYTTLKGAGQITEVEGAKAEQAIARLDTSQSDAEFKAALKDLQDVISSGMARARLKAQMPTGSVAPATPSVGGFKYLGKE